MPKMKTKRAAAKRFRMTGGGKIKHGKAYRRHIMSSKNAKRKRHLAGGSYVDPTQEKQIKLLIPYA